MGMKQKNFFLKKKKTQNGQLKKTEIFKIANSQKIFAKISQIDAKGIDVAQPMWMSGCPT